MGSFSSKKISKLYFGNSGTLARLIIGIITSTPNISLKVFGDKSLNKRNMKKLIELMSKFGAEFLPKNKFFFPLRIISSNYPIGISYESGVSAQLKSAVMLAGLNSYGNTEIKENFKSRDHTENMLKKNKSAIKIKNGKEKNIKIFGKQDLEKFSLNVLDPSSRFFTALTLLKENSLTIKMWINPTRIGFYFIKNSSKIKFSNKKN